MSNPQGESHPTMSFGLVATAPSTPTNPSHAASILYGPRLGGVDALNAEFPLHTSTRRESHAASSPRLRYAAPLGSPVLLRSSTKRRLRPRPLARASPAPIPLWEYPTPTRTEARLFTMWGDSPTRGPSTPRRSMGLRDLLLGSPATPGSEPGIGSIASRIYGLTRSGRLAAAGDSLSTAVALAVVAAVNETISREYLFAPGGRRDSTASLNADSEAACDYVDEVFGQEAHPSHFSDVFLASNRSDWTEVARLEPVVEESSGKAWDIPGGSAARVPEAGPGLTVGTAQDEDQCLNTAATDAQAHGDARVCPSETPNVYVPASSPLAPIDPTMAVNSLNFWEAFPPQRRPIAPVDASFLLDCNIATFNPRRPTYTCFDILMRLVSFYGSTTGTTKTELKQIFKSCVLCQRYMYAERRAQHRCEAQGLQGVDSPVFDLVSKMLSFEVHSGMSSTELTSLLLRCDDCSRVVHASPGSVLDPDSVFYPHRCPSRAGN